MEHEKILSLPLDKKDNYVLPLEWVPHSAYCTEWVKENQRQRFFFFFFPFLWRVSGCKDNQRSKSISSLRTEQVARVLQISQWRSHTVERTAGDHDLRVSSFVKALALCSSSIQSLYRLEKETETQGWYCIKSFIGYWCGIWTQLKVISCIVM